MKRTPEIQIKLEELQKERETLNRKAQKNEYLPYRVAAVNKKLIRDFGGGFKIEEDWILYVFNKAALYLTNFQLKEYKYIITPVDFVGGLDNRVWDAYDEVKEREVFEKDVFSMVSIKTKMSDGTIKIRKTNTNLFG